MKIKQHADIPSPELIPLKELSFATLTPRVSASSSPNCHLTDQDFGILLKLMKTQTRL